MDFKIRNGLIQTTVERAIHILREAVGGHIPLWLDYYDVIEMASLMTPEIRCLLKLNSPFRK